MNRAMIGMLWWAALCGGVLGPAGAGAEPSPLRRTKFLLLDARLIDSTQDAVLRAGRVKKHPANPLFAEDKPWEPRFDNLYANVIYDQEDRSYKCWYSPFVIDRAHELTPRAERADTTYNETRRRLREEGRYRREMGVCYAVSKDGLKWTKPLLDIYPWKGEKSNVLLVGPHGAGVFKDLRETDPDRRFRMFYQGMNVRFSPDGLHWSDPVPCPEIRARGDTHNNAFWAPERNKYVGITRLWDGQRIVGRTESEDFLQWTKAVEVLRGTRELQTYAMPVFRYADVYLGLVMVIRTREDRVHCELTWSPDTITWYRVDEGTPLIPNSGTRGDYDWGTVYGAATPIVLKDEIRLYYGGCNGQHTNFRDGFFCLATLRPDGFAGYEPDSPQKPGVVITKPVVCTGAKLRLSADAAEGSVRVEVVGAEGLSLDGCRPVRGDATDACVEWVSGADLSAWKGRAVRLKFRLERATLYAFRFCE